jgi:hypothetical protein
MKRKQTPETTPVRTAAWHLERFADFAAKIKAISGCTPHVTQVAKSAENLPWTERLWRGGCYAAVYNYPTAEVIWQNWPGPKVVLRNPARFTKWIAENWAGLPLRKERKAVNAPLRLATCVLSFAAWAESTVPRAVCQQHIGYEEAWEAVNKIQFFGRYISIRFLEYLHRVCELRAVMYDSRPVGGPYPRQGLALLYPQFATALLGGNSAEECKESNRAAELCLHELRQFRVYLKHYELQSMICEYKQAFNNGKQYPVKALDSELGYYNRVTDYWNRSIETQFFTTRAAAFRHEALGELQGWAGKRKELGGLLRNYGYNWSDLQYDYNATAAAQAWAAPVKRGAA